MAKGGGAWKVAYADFVTAMMAFFMVMWLVGQKPEVKEAIAEHFRSPTGRRITGNPNSSLLPSRQDGAGGRKNRQRAADDDTTQTKMTDEGKRSNVGTIVTFEANRVVLDQNAEKQLSKLIPEIIGNPNRIEIRGHAAEDSLGGIQAHLDAWQISYQRSIETMRYLVSHGIAPERIRLSQAGGSEPLFVGTKPDHQQDSRVEVFMLNDLYEKSDQKSERLISMQNDAMHAEPPPPTPEELAAAAAAAGGHGGH